MMIAQRLNSMEFVEKKVEYEVEGQMEQFIERLDTLLDNDPFSDIDWNSLSHNDCELLEKYRLKYIEERRRLREERKTKTVI
ncbi:unnamed protein product [Rotaria sp. Silwood2]|nr:unnamed protein product [Rotaria sp. Silwood2]CAF4109013.1 unnamed protein product [Rotaria sp. Silwood2]